MDRLYHYFHSRTLAIHALKYVSLPTHISNIQIPGTGLFPVVWLVPNQILEHLSQLWYRCFPWFLPPLSSVKKSAWRAPFNESTVHSAVWRILKLTAIPSTPPTNLPSSRAKAFRLLAISQEELKVLRPITESLIFSAVVHVVTLSKNYQW